MIDEILNEYAEIKTKYDTINGSTKEELFLLKRKMDELKFKILDIQNDLGLDSVKTSAYTVYTSTVTYYTVQDWEAYIDWVKRTGNYNCFTRAVSKEGINELDELPPGIGTYDELRVNVRKNRGK
jgi:hypothetical protein